MKLRGQPIPKFFLLADGYEETLELPTTIHADRDASMGATFQLLKRRPNIARQFVLLRMDARDGEQERTHALLFEELDSPRRWWMSTHLFPFLRAFVEPPPGSRPAHILPPRLAQPDIAVAMDALPAAAPTPTNARMMTELIAQLAVDDLLTSAVKGTVVVRYAQRVWEMWVLGEDMPAELEDMVRYIANKRAPPAEGVGVAMIAIRPWGRFVAERTIEGRKEHR